MAAFRHRFDVMIQLGCLNVQLQPLVYIPQLARMFPWSNSGSVAGGMGQFHPQLDAVVALFVVVR